MFLLLPSFDVKLEICHVAALMVLTIFQASDMLTFLALWTHIIVPIMVVTLYALALVASGHILITKRDPRAALGWIVACLGFPGIGVVFYLLFGINRVKTRGQDWISTGMQDRFVSEAENQKNELKIPEHFITNPVFHQVKHVVDTLTMRPLVSGCHIEALHNGEEAYPRMLASIEAAQKSIYLSTYILDTNATGQQFFDALERAQKRGVDVRVLIDGFGNLYSWPSAYRALKKRGVRVAKFLPLNFSKRGIHLNLRLHRKIMVVDGRVGYTGGMNIGDRHLVKTKTGRQAVQDVHFMVTGPVVGQLQDTFLIDWYFTTEDKHADTLAYDSTTTGLALSRGIADAPDKDFEKIRLTIIGALTAAREHIRIMTPYFIPDTAMISALNAASLKGVNVEIILPVKNNLPYVKWASQAYFWELLQHNVKIFYQPAPFAHSKYLVIDDFYSLVGSANLDPRSLRLNFEFNLEVYDKPFAYSLSQHFDSVRIASQQISATDMEVRSLAVKLRDSFFKLFSPYI